MADTQPFPSLTNREREVALLLAVGVPTSQVAKRIKCAAKTVDTHRLHILKKLKVANAVELAHYAIRHKYVAVNPEQAKAA